MNLTCARLTILVVISFAGPLVMGSDPAAAQFGIERAFKKALSIPKIIGNGGGGGGSRGSGQSSGNSDRGSEESSTGGGATASKEVSAEVKRLESARLQRNVALSDREKDETADSENLERQRDVEQAVRVFLSCLKGLHGVKGNEDGGFCTVSKDDTAVKSPLISQVTAGEVIREVEAAYKQARLYDFERLAGELWTRERLMVRIVDRSRRELPPYFQGVGAKGPSMDDLKQIFQKNAVEVYADSLEVSEVIGGSQSFDRLIRTIYEKSAKSSFSLWTDGADSRYERFVTAALGSVPRTKFVKNDETQALDPLGLKRQFQFRYRARRVIYDCLSVNYHTLVGKKSSAGTMEVRSDSAPSQAGGGAGGTSSAVAAAVAPASIETGSQTDARAQEAVWIKAQEFVQSSCKDGIEDVAKTVVANRVQPESARWISTKSMRPAAAVAPVGPVTPEPAGGGAAGGGQPPAQAP